VTVLFSSQATYEASLPGPELSVITSILALGYALYHYTPQKDEGNGCADMVRITCFEVSQSKTPFVVLR